MSSVEDSGLDPAYQYEFEQLADLCRQFLKAHEADSRIGRLLLTGMITAQCAMIYKLSPQAGILDPADLFTRDDSGD